LKEDYKSAINKETYGTHFYANQEQPSKAQIKYSKIEPLIEN